MRNKVICFIIIICMLLGIQNFSYAASFTVSSSKSSVTVGDTFTISINAPGITGRFNISSNSNVTLNQNSVWIEAGATTNITATAKSAGTATITVSTVTISDANGNDIPNDSKTCSVTIKEKSATTPQTPATPTTSTATLTSLTIGEKTYSNPSKDITVNVDNETDNIAVKAVTSNGEACSISSTSGSKSSPVKLSEGTTNIYITLASGTKYTIRVQRAAKKVETQPNVMEQNNEEKPEEKVKLLLDSLKVNGFDIQPEFSPEIYSYKIDINMDENDVKDLDIEAKANTEDAKIEISGEKDLKEGENLVTITVTSADGAENVVYQIVVNKIVTSSEVVSLENTIQDSILQEENNTPSKMQIIIVAVAIVTAILGIIFAIVEYNYTKNDEEDFGKGNIFDYDKELKTDDENNESNGYVEELYKSKNIENEFEDFNDEKRKKKSKGKH